MHYNKYSLRLLIKNEAGSHLLSHTVSSAVPSAAYVLTIVFGMGTGVTRKRITTGKFPHAFACNGDEGIRTLDPLLARQVLSQLSYTPIGYEIKWA